ncbi:hypothetical protein L484_019222 [Morus notabilis]|uniref:Peptidase A2 domain-containing protein n=1 Tax=Morus notabilis TaxID=981085 RepID=W9RD17_9ROSA|nr:hypothetical protein L484_019222 [Morus notabilis]
MEAPYFDHKRPLYLKATVNNVHVRRVLVDVGSSINIIPSFILTTAGVPPGRITKKKTLIAGFAAERKISNPFSTLFSSWPDIKDLDDQDWCMASRKRQKKQKFSRCVKIFLPDGKCRDLTIQNGKVPGKKEEYATCAGSEAINASLYYE